MVAIATASFFGASCSRRRSAAPASLARATAGEMTIVVETPPGSNLEYTRLKAEEAVRIARAHEEVAYTYTTIGGQSGAVDNASMYVRLHPKADRERTLQDVGADVRVAGEPRRRRHVLRLHGYMSGTFKQIQLELRGADAGELTRIASQMADVVRAVPGAVDVGLSARGEKPEVIVELNRGLAGPGHHVAQVAQSLRPAFAGIDVGDWVDPDGETRDVMIRLAPEARQRASDLGQLPITTAGPDGTTMLPLGQIANVQEGISPAQIDHLDRERVVSIQANVAGRSAERGHGRHRCASRGDRAARRLPPHEGRRVEGPGRGVRPHLHRARHRRAADVPDPGPAVRIVPGSHCDPALAAALADRAQVVSVAAQGAIMDMRRRVQERVTRLPIRFFDGTRSAC
jgi:hydrophobic/amphiphilic exporter-1 (mainly G- bacteria), HAE1 family